MNINTIQPVNISRVNNVSHFEEILTSSGTGARNEQGTTVGLTHNNNYSAMHYRGTGKRSRADLVHSEVDDIDQSVCCPWPLPIKRKNAYFSPSWLLYPLLKS